MSNRSLTQPLTGYNRYWGEPDWDDEGNRMLASSNRRAGYSYYKQGGGAASYYYGEKGYNFSYGVSLILVLLSLRHTYAALNIFDTL